MNESLERYGFEGAARILSADELESHMELARQRVARMTNRALVSALALKNPQTFKLFFGNRNATCPPEVLIPIVGAEIEYRKCVDAEWDDDLLNGQQARKNLRRVMEC